MGAALRAILAFCRGLGRGVTATPSSVTGAEVGDTLAWFWQPRPWQTQHPLPVSPLPSEPPRTGQDLAWWCFGFAFPCGQGVG